MSRRLLFLFAALPVSAKEPAPSAAPEVPEMQTDRPDTTESPFTVVRGMWQVETEILSYERDSGQTSLLWGVTNLKYGLSDTMDIQLVTPGWMEQNHGPDGWTDMEIRLKCNLTGPAKNPPLSWGLIPFVKAPVASHGLGNGNWEGGLILPMATSLSETVDLAWMVEGDLVRNEADNGWTGAATVSASLGIEVTKRLASFAELAATFTAGSKTELYGNTGLILTINPNWTVDAGVNVGLTGASTDLRLFTGTSFRF
jgi:hypothetical protein